MVPDSLTCYIYSHQCPKCGQFTGPAMTHAKWAFGEQTHEEYIYCNNICYENMEYSYYLQEQSYHEE